MIMTTSRRRSVMFEEAEHFGCSCQAQPHETNKSSPLLCQQWVSKPTCTQQLYGLVAHPRVDGRLAEPHESSSPCSAPSTKAAPACIPVKVEQANRR